MLSTIGISLSRSYISRVAEFTISSLGIYVADKKFFWIHFVISDPKKILKKHRREEIHKERKEGGKILVGPSKLLSPGRNPDRDEGEKKEKKELTAGSR